MPLWRIFHPKNFYTPQEKEAFSKAITDLYNKKSTAKLPRFYVVVLFTPYDTPSSTSSTQDDDSSAMYVAGEPRNDFIRIVIEQIARRIGDDEVSRMHTWTGWVEETIAPFVKDKPTRDGLAKNIDWEIHIDQTSRELWRINGHIPPMPSSEGENAWREAGKAVPYEN